MARRSAPLTLLLLALCGTADAFLATVHAQTPTATEDLATFSGTPCLPTEVLAAGTPTALMNPPTEQSVLVESPQDPADPPEPAPGLPATDPPGAGPRSLLGGSGSALPSAFQLPVNGPVLLFAEAGQDDPAAFPSGKYISQAGLGWKRSSPGGTELFFRCGPEVWYEDTPHSERTSAQPAVPIEMQWLRLDAQCRWALPGDVGLEYQGTACPALVAGEHDRVSQDVRVVVPVGRLGELRLGARHTWETSADARSWAEGSQVYGGLRLGW